MDLRKRIKESLRFIMAVVVVSTVLVNSVQKITIHGISMCPAFRDGDIVIAEKVTRWFSRPERYDIIVFHYLYGEEQYYVKRVIGLPGETVQITDGKILINGESLDESYGPEPVREARRAAVPVVLGEDEYFVLGDNRNYSSDSRDSDVAEVTEDQIIGRVWFRLWPLK